MIYCTYDTNCQKPIIIQKLAEENERLKQKIEQLKEKTCYKDGFNDGLKLFEQEKCELLGIIQQKDELIKKLICCGNCKHHLRDCQHSINCLKNNYKDWELAE